MLIKLYSETNLLKQPFTFIPGINIILGKYSGDREQKGINGIGKSSLVRLINYALLSDSSETRFSKEKYNFLRKDKHNIVLELRINNELYYIKRFFSERDTIYFGTNIHSLEKYSKKELKTVLGNKLFPVENREVLLKGNRFGTIMSFFIKDDLDNQSRIDPLKFLTFTTNMREIAIYNFYLLNLSTKHIIKYDELVNEFDGYNKTIKGLQQKIELDTGKTIEGFKTERIKIEQNILMLEKSLHEYKFLENYKNIEKELVEVTASINEKLKMYYSLSNKLKKQKILSICLQILTQIKLKRCTTKFYKLLVI